MDSNISDRFEAIANSMGIALYQKFSLTEASLFLRCPDTEIIQLVNTEKLRPIKSTSKNIQFFGFQLLEHILSTLADKSPAAINATPPTQDQILRIKEVEKMVGLSRPTIWRWENKGEFPRRVSLGGNAVGWRLSEIQAWVTQREQV